MKTLLPIALFLASFFATWLIPTRPTSPPEKASTPTLSTRKTSSKSPSQNAHQELTKIARLTDPQTRLQHLIAYANSLPIEQLESALTATNLAPLDPSLRTLLLSITCDRWLNAAPADLIAWNASTRLIDTHQYLARWLVMDRPFATNYLLNKNTGYSTQHSISESIQHLVKLDPTLAFDFAKEQLQPSSGLRFHTSTTILLTLAKHDPEALRALAPALPDYLQDTVTAALVSELFKSEFPAALSQLTAQEGGIKQLSSIQSMIDRDTFVETLVTNIDQLPKSWLPKLIENFTFSYSPATLPLLESSPQELGVSDKTFATLMLRQYWHDFGPEARPRLLAIINNPDLPLAARKNLLNGQLQFWIKNSSPEMVDQLNTIQDPTLRELLLKDHESVKARLQKTNPNAETKLPVREHGDWTSSQTQEALTLFKNASAADQRNTLLQIKDSSWGDQPNRPYLSQVLATIAAQDPPPLTETHHEDLLTTAYFANDWALDSPAQAAAWVTKLPPGDHRLWAAKNVARTWHLYSPTEAAAWITTLPSADQAVLHSFLENEAR